MSYKIGMAYLLGKVRVVHGRVRTLDWGMKWKKDCGLPRLVLIEWEDSHGDGAWHQLDGEIEDRALVCRSVGWLVLDGERAKVIVPHLSEQDAGVPLQGSGVMTIPASAVLRIVGLEVPD